MKRLWKIEWYKVLHDPVFYICAVIGCTISILHFLLCVLPLGGVIYSQGAEYPLTVYGKWIGIDNATVYASLLYFVLPILASFPVCGTVKEDIQTGYIRSILIRGTNREYFMVKYAVTFLTAGFLTILPLILNFLLTALVLPLLIPQANTFLFPIWETWLMDDLFYKHPLVYVLAYLALDFIFIGLLSGTGLLAAFFCEKRFTVMMTPYIIYLFLFAFTQVSGMGEISPSNFLRPGQPIAGNGTVIVCEILILLLAGGCYAIIGKKKEIY